MAADEDWAARIEELTAALEAQKAECRQLQFRLRAAEQRQRFMIEAVKDYAIYELDLSGHIASWNEGARRLLGYRTEEALGLPTDVTFTEEDRRAGRPHAELREAREQGSARDENWTVRKDGSRFWASGFTTAVKDENGQLQGYLKIFRDLTQQREATEVLQRSRDELEQRVEERTAELRHSQERVLQTARLASIGQTMAGLAHESRNTLQNIHAFAERLRWRLEDRPEALQLVAGILHAKDDLERLFEDVRAYAAPIRLGVRPCDLAAVWRQAWNDVATRYPAREARLIEKVQGTDLNCLADPFRLGQVFRNAFDNALAAGQGPAEVTVSCTEETLDGRPALRISLRDNGPGLNEEQRQHLFVPFYTTKTRGTGLGMAIARRVIDALGGQISLGPPGIPGAEIIFIIPRQGV